MIRAIFPIQSTGKKQEAKVCSAIFNELLFTQKGIIFLVTQKYVIFGETLITMKFKIDHKEKVAIITSEVEKLDAIQALIE